MTMDDIFTMVKKAMKEPSSSGHWTDAQLYAIASRIQEMVVGEVPGMLETKWTQTLSTDDQELTIPTAFLNIESVMFDGRKLWQTTLRDLDIQSEYGFIQDKWQDWSGQPKYYYLRSELMGIVPKVGSAYDSKTLTIYGTRKPTTLASSTDVPYENLTKYYPWHDLIVEGMMWHLKLADENEFYREHKSEYLRRLETLKYFAFNKRRQFTKSYKRTSSGVNIYGRWIYRRIKKRTGFQRNRQTVAIC
jgi:hypothetical protein